MVQWFELALGPKPLPESQTHRPDPATGDKPFKPPLPQLKFASLTVPKQGLGFTLLPASWASRYPLQVGPGLPNTKGHSAAPGAHGLMDPSRVPETNRSRADIRAGEPTRQQL